MKTNDGGLNWDFLPLPNYPGIGIHTVYFINADTGWIAGEIKTIYATTDGGDSWTIQNMPDWEGNFSFHDIYFYDAMHGCAVGGVIQGDEKMIIFTTDNGGADWTEILPEDYGVLHRVQFIDEMTVWTCDQHDGRLYKSLDGGYTWSEVYIEFSGYFTGMSFPSETTGYISTNKSQIFKTMNSGNSWDVIELPFDSIYVRDMQFLNDYTGFFTFDDNHLCKTLNGGLDWETFIIDELETIKKIDFMDANEGWALGDEGILAHTFNGGQTWSISVLPSNYATDLDFVDHMNGHFISWNDGGVFRTIDGGISWQEQNLNLNWWSQVVFIDSLHGWINFSDELYFTGNGGISWELILNIDSAYNSEYITDFFISDANHGWISTYDGRIFSCSDLVGIKEVETGSEIKLYPNPANGLINIELGESDPGEIRLKIFSVDGRIRKSETSISNPGKITLDISSLEPGIYILRMTSANGTMVGKMLKM
jgi:photosystem II stability/assembly factor-like uncharacterized protein